jgi:hypothetical protein
VNIYKERGTCELLTDPQEGRSILRLTNVLVHGWVGGKHACVDLTGVFPLVGLGTRDFTVGQTSLKVALSNVAKKHEKVVLTINMFLFICNRHF